jgi:hypothetical protein
MRARLLTAEHEMLRRSVRSFVEREVVPPAREEAGHIRHSFWPRMGELGFLGLAFPEESGGGGIIEGESYRPRLEPKVRGGSVPMPRRRPRARRAPPALLAIDGTGEEGGGLLDPGPLG